MSGAVASGEITAAAAPSDGGGIPVFASLTRIGPLINFLMMKNHLRIKGFERLTVGFLSAFVVLAGSCLHLEAQVNARKVERDATGVYKGTASGARYQVTYDNGSPSHGGTVDAVAARARVPVKDGKLSSSFTDSELPSDRALAKGTERRSDVVRGGRRVIVRAVGTLNLYEGPTKGIWTNGNISGNLDKKGKVWNARTTASAQQRNGLPPDHTKRVTGMNLRGRG